MRSPSARLAGLYVAVATIAGFAVLVTLTAITPAVARAAQPGGNPTTPTRVASADADAIRAVGQRWMALYQAGDFAAIPELYTEDAIIMARGRPRMEGRAALRQSIGKLAAGRKVDIDITERELEVRGDMAWLITDFKVTYSSAQPATAPVVEYGRSMLIFLRGADGQWRIHRDMDSPAPAPDGRPQPG